MTKSTIPGNIPARMEHGVCRSCGKDSHLCALVRTRNYPWPVFWCSSCRVNYAGWHPVEPQILNGVIECKEKVGERDARKMRSLRAKSKGRGVEYCWG